MTQANTKPSAAVVYDMQTAQHAQNSVMLDFELLADAKRLGGIANKEWRTSFMVGSMAGIAKKPLDWAADVLTKANPDSKGKPKRTQAEQKVYDAARARLSRFCKVHSITPANKKRGKPGKPAKDEPKDNTPKAINAKQVDSYLRMQAAVMLAYLEKNGAMAESRDAWHSALQELKESVAAIPVVLSDRELAETK